VLFLIHISIFRAACLHLTAASPAFVQTFKVFAVLALNDGSLKGNTINVSVVLIVRRIAMQILAQVIFMLALLTEW